MSSIVLSVILAHPGEGSLDHPIAFARRKLLTIEINYMTTKRQGIAMVYSLQKFQNDLFSSHSKMFTDPFSLKYLVNKLVLGGNICQRFSYSNDFILRILSSEDDLMQDLATFRR